MNITTIEVKNLKIDEVTWVFYLGHFNITQFIGTDPTDEAIDEFSKDYAERAMVMVNKGQYDNASYTMPKEERTYEYQYNNIHKDLIDMRSNGTTKVVMLKKGFIYDGSSDFISRFENWKLENNLIEDEVSVKFI